MRTILNALKVLTGRRLSEETVKLARVFVESPFYRNSFGGGFRGNKEKRVFSWFNISEGKDSIIRTSNIEKLATTRDTSHRYQTHTGFYPTENEKRVYNLDGLLVSRTLKQNFLDGQPSTTKIINYSPAGRFIGNSVQGEVKGGSE